MKKQLLFVLTALIGTSCVSLQAMDSEHRSKRTTTGKSSWTICKGIAKIVIGAPIALGGFKKLIVFLPMLGIGAVAAPALDDGAAVALIGFGGSVVSAGCLVGGGALAYSGVKDLNENEEFEAEEIA